MRNKHKWEELFIDEFFKKLAECPLAFLTTAPVEDHGAHNTLAVDMTPMYELALAVAEKIGGIVFPQVPFGQAGAPPWTYAEIRSGKHNLFPPSMFFSRELCRQIYVEMFEGMARMGFKVCVALGGHGPEITALQAFSKEHNELVDGMRLLTPHWPSLLKQADFYNEVFPWPRAMAHSGIIETSLMMYLRPELVDLKKSFEIYEASYATQTKIYLPEKSHIKDLQENASAELGKKAFVYLVDAIAGLTQKAMEERGREEGQKKVKIIN